MAETPFTLDPRRTALLVMDYQRGITDSLDDAEALLDRAADVVKLVRDLGGRIGYVRVGFTDDEFDAVPATSTFAQHVGSERRQYLHADAPTTAVHDRVAPQPGDIAVRKTRVGAFSTTDLDRQLRAVGIDTLVLAGISTSGVVLSTVREAADRDYRIVVLADACADRETAVHEFLTERIFPRQAHVTSTGELAALLSTD
ncbi:MAG TPA: cysteine hydrolase [Actinocrinis sp.]|jgi:nicotinamidase-related amidase